LRKHAFKWDAQRMYGIRFQIIHDTDELLLITPEQQRRHERPYC
jgi:hypothetical protein